MRSITSLRREKNDRARPDQWADIYAPSKVKSQTGMSAACGEERMRDEILERG
jgi:hypothetical protein